MTMSSVKSLAAHGTPLELTTLSIGPDGELTRRDPVPIRFVFTCDGIEFEAEARRDGAESILHVSAALGHMPFSVEGTWRRVDVSYLISASRHRREGRLIATRDGVLRYDSTVKILAPLTPVTVLTAATEAVARGKRLIDLARLYMVAPRSKTQVTAASQN
jgi:hypothetical protein